LHYPGTGYKSVADLPPICYCPRASNNGAARSAVCCIVCDLLRC